MAGLRIGTNPGRSRFKIDTKNDGPHSAWPFVFVMKTSLALPAILVALGGPGISQPLPKSCPEIKSHLDSIPAIDTHDHLWRFDELPGLREAADGGKVMNLSSIWQNSYLSWHNVLPAWQPRMEFRDWWAKARAAFDDVRAMSVYRYTLPAIRDLYGIDFEAITDEQAATLNSRITANYRDQRWLYEVVTERANIEVMLNDPYWEPFDFRCHYGFVANVLRLNPLFQGFHPSEFAMQRRKESPYDFAKANGIEIASFDGYLAFIDRLFAMAKQAGVVGLKHTLAYQRTLDFAKSSKEQAAAVFGRKREALQPAEIKAFQDFIMWHLCELSAKHQLPFQIHTGHARIQGSNPLLLTDLLQANPRTTFILFHGGYPWVGESAAIAVRCPNVYLDSVWLPTLSQHMARRAFHEWLDAIPSTRIMWGADCNHAEGIYGATAVTRQVLAEVLAGRVDRGDLTMDAAKRIGRQILRDNALAVFPGLREKLWRHKQAKLAPPGAG